MIQHITQYNTTKEIIDNAMLSHQYLRLDIIFNLTKYDILLFNYKL